MEWRYNLKEIKRDEYYLIAALNSFKELTYYVGKPLFDDKNFDNFDCGEDWIWPENIIAIAEIEKIKIKEQ